MRLFIAINFNTEIKNYLLEGIDKLKACASKGNFTKEDNLHLTLVFIGETNKLSDVKIAMENINANSFDLTIGGLGKFKRSGGKIYWIGVEKNNPLNSIYNQLYTNLKKSGFVIENREYRPHITLGREVVLLNEPSLDAKKLRMNVNKISLMKSERINGKLVYTEIHSKGLQ